MKGKTKLPRTSVAYQRGFPEVRWKEYNDARRWNKKVSIEDFTDYFELQYERVPGYENLSQEAYAKVMRAKLEDRIKEIVASRQGRPAMGKVNLLRLKAGATPYRTKTSTIRNYRPRILSKDNERRAKGKAWYFSIYFDYREKSASYREGKLDVVFPEGTYRPPLFTVRRSGPMWEL